jgi:hypothetical protein
MLEAIIGYFAKETVRTGDAGAIVREILVLLVDVQEPGAVVVPRLMQNVPSAVGMPLMTPASNDNPSGSCPFSQNSVAGSPVIQKLVASFEAVTLALKLSPTRGTETGSTTGKSSVTEPPLGGCLTSSRQLPEFANVKGAIVKNAIASSSTPTEVYGAALGVP